MANQLGNYSPLFYAQEGLIQLEKALGMAARVHRGYDRERRTFNKGSRIEIRRPSTFTALDAPSDAQDVNTGMVSIHLNQWKEVKFKITDQEYAYTGEQIIAEHIRPAAYALADKIDRDLCGMALDVGHTVTYAGTTADIAGAKKKLFDAGVPIDDVANNHYMFDGTAQMAYEQLQAFAQYQGAAELGVNTQLRGQLGVRYNFQHFANQNVIPSAVPAVVDGAGAVNQPTEYLTGIDGYPAGATEIALDGLGATETYYRGQVVSFDGHTGQYTLAANATAVGGAVTITLTGPLQEAIADGEAVTIASNGNVLAENLAFHTNFAALAFAKLPDRAREMGALVESVQDPKTGLALRARMYYVGNSSEVHVALDALYGYEVLDGNMACRVIRTS